MHACMSELGVSLTRELGFHQVRIVSYSATLNRHSCMSHHPNVEVAPCSINNSCSPLFQFCCMAIRYTLRGVKSRIFWIKLQMDIQGDAFGLLAAHPQTPLVSLHHLDAILPIFPNYTRGGALTHLLKASKIESPSLLQQSICYADGKKWSISLSWGFVVQIYKEFLTPRVLETTIRTFASCRRRTDKVDFPFNTRDNSKEVCLRPSLFYMESARGPSADTDGFLETIYVRENDWKKRRACESELKPLSSVQRIRVLKEPTKEIWYLVSRILFLRSFLYPSDTDKLSTVS